MDRDFFHHLFEFFFLSAGFHVSPFTWDRRMAHRFFHPGNDFFFRRQDFFGIKKEGMRFFEKS
jgi:hypothetical protein